MNTTREEVHQLISSVLGVPAEQLTPDTRIRSIPDVESIKVLTVILKVEKKLGIEIPDDATFRLETIGQFLDLVDHLKAQQGAPQSRAV